MFDPNLQVPYSDSWTSASSARSAGRPRSKSGTSARGAARSGRRSTTTSRTSWTTGSSMSSGWPRPICSRTSRRDAAGGATRARLRIAVPTPTRRRCRSIWRSSAASRATRPATRRCTRRGAGPTRTSSTPSSRFDSNPFTPAGTNSNTGLAGNPTRQANAIRAGLPANFFRVNPDMLGGANATGNRGSSAYNAMQLQFRRRLTGGFQFDANYTYGSGTLSEHYSFRVPRVQMRAVGGEGDVTHAFKATGFYELPFGQGRRFGPAPGSGRSADQRVAGQRHHAPPERPAVRSRQRAGRRHERKTKSGTCSNCGSRRHGHLRVAAGDHRRDDQGVQHQRDVADRLQRSRCAERQVLRAGQRHRTASRGSPTTTATAAYGRSSSRDRWWRTSI